MFPYREASTLVIKMIFKVKGSWKHNKYDIGKRLKLYDLSKNNCYIENTIIQVTRNMCVNLYLAYWLYM